MRTPFLVCIAGLLAVASCTSDVPERSADPGNKGIDEAGGLAVVSCWLEHGDEFVDVMCDIPQTDAEVLSARSEVLAGPDQSYFAQDLATDRATRIVGLATETFAYPVEVRGVISHRWPEGVRAPGSLAFTMVFTRNNTGRQDLVVPMRLWNVTVRNAFTEERFAQMRYPASTIALPDGMEVAVAGQESTTLESPAGSLGLSRSGDAVTTGLLIPFDTAAVDIEVEYHSGRSVIASITGPGTYWLTDEGLTATDPGSAPNPNPTPDPDPNPAGDCDPNGTNESVTTAVPLNGTLMDELCAGDADWFLVDGSGESATVAINFEHAAGDLDMLMTDGEGNTINESAGSSDEELLSGVTPFWVQIIGYEGATNRYQISRM